MTVPSPDFLDLQSALAGEYSIQREIGRGGMGIVYLARDVQLDRDVAIKVLPPALASTAESRHRFLREARTAAGLSHPHIVPIHRVGEASGVVFFVMTYIDGETLGERLRTRGPLPPDDAARVMREVAWALAYAHGRGIVHRDIKPDNILLEAGTGRALVTDFGIAHRHTSERERERESERERSALVSTDPASGMIMGTAHFMSPEQAANVPVDGRSDIYALGVVGYLAVSGRLPFEAASLPAFIVRQATETPLSVARAAPGVPAALAATIDRCLARLPEQRFPDGEALAAALAPAPDARQVLAASLRAWLNARNSLLLPYLGWSSAISVLALGNLFNVLTDHPGSSPIDVVLLLIGASLPAIPIVGFHLNQARRQFKAGHTLADIRSALEVARRERIDSQPPALAGGEALTHRLLRVGTIASAVVLAATMGQVIIGTMTEQQLGLAFVVLPILSTMLLGAISNALDVQFIPDRVRTWWQTGIRDRLWNSRAGEWIAQRLGAPERSHAVGGGVFRATEAALGIAASELFTALPAAYREQLRELPATVAALEAQAAAARADMDVIAALATSGAGEESVLDRRRAASSVHLGQSVAALEAIRLDLLRLHAGSYDLASLTTLLGEARELGEEVRRLAAAQREVDDSLNS